MDGGSGPGEHDETEQSSMVSQVYAKAKIMLDTVAATKKERAAVMNLLKTADHRWKLKGSALVVDTQTHNATKGGGTPDATLSSNLLLCLSLLAKCGSERKAYGHFGFGSGEELSNVWPIFKTLGISVIGFEIMDMTLTEYGISECSTTHQGVEGGDCSLKLCTGTDVVADEVSWLGADNQPLAVAYSMIITAPGTYLDIMRTASDNGVEHLCILVQSWQSIVEFVTRAIKTTKTSQSKIDFVTKIKPSLVLRSSGEQKEMCFIDIPSAMELFGEETDLGELLNCHFALQMLSDIKPVKVDSDSSYNETGRVKELVKDLLFGTGASTLEQVSWRKVVTFVVKRANLDDTVRVMMESYDDEDEDMEHTFLSALEPMCDDKENEKTVRYIIDQIKPPSATSAPSAPPAPRKKSTRAPRRLQRHTANDIPNTASTKRIQESIIARNRTKMTRFLVIRANTNDRHITKVASTVIGDKRYLPEFIDAMDLTGNQIAARDVKAIRMIQDDLLEGEIVFGWCQSSDENTVPGLDVKRNIFANALCDASTTEAYLLTNQIVFTRSIIYDTTNSMRKAIVGRKEMGKKGISCWGLEKDGWLNEIGQVIIAMTHFMDNGCILYFPEYFTTVFHIEKYVMKNPIIMDVLELVPDLTEIPFGDALAHVDHDEGMAVTNNATAYRRKDREAPPLPLLAMAK